MDSLNALRDLIQNDVGNRGLRKDPCSNLVNAFPSDFAAACRSMAEHPPPSLAIVTGFFIPTATPPAGETDGPLGALFLARALVPLGISVAIATDQFCVRALESGLEETGLANRVPLIVLPTPMEASKMTDEEYRKRFRQDLQNPPITHLLAIERVGPSHTHDNVPPADRDRCHTMRGRDITDLMSPAHWLFESSFEAEAQVRDIEIPPSLAHRAHESRAITIGIGDGGNEIGMGKIPWDVIDRNIPNGGRVACRIVTDHLIVCGVSNWGAYALAAGVRLLRGFRKNAGERSEPTGSDLFDSAHEREILQRMVRDGPLVDGVTGEPTATVDGLTWELYASVLMKIGEIVGA